MENEVWMMAEGAKFIFPSLETERMVLRILTLEDAEEVFKHFSDANITEFMDIEPCKDMKETEEIIQFHLDDKGCRWGLFEKENGGFMGTCGFHCWESEKAEIGYDLSKTYWGKGFMAEAIQAMIEFGFREMGLRTIDATVEPENVRSIKLLTKLGFKREPELKDNLIYFYKRLFS